jgi:hypothetical protein
VMWGEAKFPSGVLPWGWTLYLTATSCVLADSIDIKSQFQIDETAPARREITQRQVIRVQMPPSRPRDDGDFRRETKFSMFGTD